MNDRALGGRPLPGWREVVLVKHVPAKDQLIGSCLEVDPYDRFMNVPALGGRPLDLATRVRGRGQQRGDSPRGRAYAGRIDAVPDEWGAQVDLPSGVARRRRDRREVAREHLGRRDVRNVARRRLTQDGALIAAKKEQLVADD